MRSVWEGFKIAEERVSLKYVQRGPGICLEILIDDGKLLIFEYKLKPVRGY